LLLGQRQSLPANMIIALQAVGLTHMVVASGYNLTVLVRLARRLFAKVSKYLAFLAAGGMALFFMAITGLSPSMLRAGLVTGISLTAWYYGRQLHPVVILAIVLAATTMINPSYAWVDIGWQLSFAAFAGVMIVAPLATRYLFGDQKIGFLPQVLIETIAAQMVTWPIIAAAFGQVSNVAVVANLLIVPLVPLAMLLSFVAGIGGWLVPVVANVIGLPATWLLGFMTNAVNYFAALPWAVNTWQPTAWMVVAYYGLIVALVIYLWQATGYNLRHSNIAE